MNILRLMTNLFALWVTLGTAWAWVKPDHFIWFKDWIRPGLGIIMLGMGITLRFEDFKRVLLMPKSIAIGLFAQFLIMPLLGWGLARGFGLEAGLAVGLILVSCCPGGTASNVITFLSRANLPLSVLLTMCSTTLAVVMTPILTKTLAGAYMNVDAWGLFKSTLMIVILPLVSGISLNQFFPKLVAKIKPVAPLVSVIVIVLIVGCIVALRKEAIREQAGILLLVIFLLHASGFTLGYMMAKLLGYAEDFRRTIAIEVGMQNSGLGAALAEKHFAADPLTAVPAAISAVIHCLIGSLLAAIWRNRPPRISGEEVAEGAESG